MEHAQEVMAAFMFILRHDLTTKYMMSVAIVTRSFVLT
jgi:hypothetical protein